MGKKNKKKLEFSKIIFICTSALFTLVVVGSFVLMWHTGSTDALISLISSTSAMVTTGVCFYYNKSKAENILKISKENNLTIQEAKSLSNTDLTSYEETNYNNYSDDM